MSFFGFLILVLIGYFVIWPIVKVAIRVRSAQRQFRDAMSGTGASAWTRASQTSRPGGWSRPFRRKPKKIGPEVGEYVAFEEVDIAEESTAEAPADFNAEPQVSDAEWEDLK